MGCPDWWCCLFDQWGVFVRGVYLHGVVVCVFVQMFVLLCFVVWRDALFGGHVLSVWVVLVCIFVLHFVNWRYSLFGYMFDVFFVVNLCCW